MSGALSLSPQVPPEKYGARFIAFIEDISGVPPDFFASRSDVQLDSDYHIDEAGCCLVEISAEGCVLARCALDPAVGHVGAPLDERGLEEGRLEQKNEGVLALTQKNRRIKRLVRAHLWRMVLK